MNDNYRLVEEVPGVPPEEQFYVSKGYGKPLKWFSTLQAARDWLKESCIEHYEFEPFSP